MRRLFREWRHRVCTYVAKTVQYVTPDSDNKASTVRSHRAFYFSEASAVGVRQQARYWEHRRQTSTDPQFFQEFTSFDQARRRLPHGSCLRSRRRFTTFSLGVTLVMLSMDENRNLWLTRCHRSHKPFSIVVANIGEKDQIVKSLTDLLLQSDESLKPQNIRIAYEELRKRLNDGVKVNSVFGSRISVDQHYRVFLIACRRSGSVRWHLCCYRTRQRTQTPPRFANRCSRKAFPNVQLQ